MWLALGTLVFYSGITWIHIQNNSDSVQRIMEAHRMDTTQFINELGSIETGLIAHINDENERTYETEHDRVKALQRRLDSLE